MLKYLPQQLQSVWLANGYKENKNGSLEISYPSSLHLQITEGILFTQPCISGPELKYIREEMDYTRAQLGKLLDISSRDMKSLEESQQIPPPAARLLRLVYDDHLGLGEIAIIERASELPSARKRSIHSLVLTLSTNADGDINDWSYNRSRVKLDNTLS